MTDFMFFTLVILATVLMIAGVVLNIPILPMLGIPLWLGLGIQLATTTDNNLFVLPFLMLAALQVFIFVMIRNKN